MAGSEIFSPDRLRLARQRRGLFAQEVAARIGVSVKTVGRWERGEKTPLDENVEMLTRVLEFPREFFFGDAPPTLEPTRFRSLARMTARQRDMALAAGAQAVALDQWISEQFERPKPNVPDYRDSIPENAAIGLRAAWGLGYRPISNLVHVLEKHGVRVYSLVHHGSEIDAFSVWQGDTPFIFLNTTKTAERSRMDASHELGHLVMHAHTAGGSTKEEENQAQLFAANFLMPAAPFIASAPNRPTLSAILDRKLTWGVSALAYVHRLHALGRLSDWQYKSLCIELKSRYSRAEPGKFRERETSQVLSKVLVPNGGMSRREIIRHLRIRSKDFDEMTFGLALTPIQGGSSAPESPPTAPMPGITLMR